MQRNADMAGCDQQLSQLDLPQRYQLPCRGVNLTNIQCGSTENGGPLFIGRDGHFGHESA
jgi:hypothetical protein